MHRRHLLAALAATAASPALAQTTTPAPADAGAGTVAGGGLYAGAAGNKPAAAMGQAEQQWMQQTMTAGAVALQTSQIAVEKAQHPKVKEFARFEADEQTVMAEVLTAMASSGAATAGAGTNTAASPAAGAAATPRASAAGMAEMLQAAKAGAEFDREYIRGQLQGHQDLLQIQETYLKSGGRNREAAASAKLARSRIQEHVTRLQDLEKEIGRG